MAVKNKKSKGKPSASKKLPATKQTQLNGSLKFILPVLALTFIIFLPALRNGFTNWDDILYVTTNPLLKDFSVRGIKAIFSTPVVSNYHPITIFSLMLNYQLAELTPWSYHLTSIFLHVINTGLIFWFTLLLSKGNKWVSAFVALLFGIHPMHVESVVWISERKDLLYTLFYLGALIIYIRYLQKKRTSDLVIVTVLGAISLLCKPAAIVLPLSLLLLDYYFKRPWSWNWILEKVPLFIMSGIIAYVTVSIQSERAIASVEMHSIVDRIFYAGFGLAWYLLKIIVPYPLSSLHPFPKELSIWYYLGTFVSVVGSILIVWKVRNKNVLFGFGFYVVNLLLVLQLVSIGSAVVAERYTYVPYIGIFFLLSIEIYNAMMTKWSKYKSVLLGIGGMWIVLLSILTWIRIPTWKSSETLWIDVLNHYPESPRAWTNKGLIYYEQKDWPKVIGDLSNALKYDPHFLNALEWRARAYLETGENDKALTDATTFYSLNPNNTTALFLKARTLDAAGRTEEALNAYNELIPLVPDIPEYINNRGVIYFNKLHKYQDAKQDFEQAIRINPSDGMYYLNLSRCYYMMGDMAHAKENGQKAKQLGAPVDDAYAKVIGLE